MHLFILAALAALAFPKPLDTTKDHRNAAEGGIEPLILDHATFTMPTFTIEVPGTESPTMIAEIVPIIDQVWISTDGRVAHAVITGIENVRMGPLDLDAERTSTGIVIKTLFEYTDLPSSTSEVPPAVVTKTKTIRSTMTKTEYIWNTPTSSIKLHTSAHQNVGDTNYPVSSTVLTVDKIVNEEVSGLPTLGFDTVQTNKVDIVPSQSAGAADAYSVLETSQPSDTTTWEKKSMPTSTSTFRSTEQTIIATIASSAGEPLSTTETTITVYRVPKGVHPTRTTHHFSRTKPTHGTDLHPSGFGGSKSQPQYENAGNATALMICVEPNYEHGVFTDKDGSDGYNALHIGDGTSLAVVETFLNDSETKFEIMVGDELMSAFDKDPQSESTPHRPQSLSVEPLVLKARDKGYNTTTIFDFYSRRLRYKDRKDDTTRQFLQLNPYGVNGVSLSSPGEKDTRTIFHEHPVPSEQIKDNSLFSISDRNDRLLYNGRSDWFLCYHANRLSGDKNGSRKLLWINRLPKALTGTTMPDLPGYGDCRPIFLRAQPLENGGVCQLSSIAASVKRGLNYVLLGAMITVAVVFCQY